MRQIFYIRIMFMVIIAGLVYLLIALKVQIRIIYEGQGYNQTVHLKLGIFSGRLHLNAKWPQPGQKRHQLLLSLVRKRAIAHYRPQPGTGGVGLMVQWRHLRQVMAAIRHSLVVLKSFLRRSVCTRLQWETGFGLDDYAATGLTTGLIWMAKGLIIGLLSRYLRIDPGGVRIAVVPQFGNTCYQSNLDCILETSFGYIIIVVLKLCVIWLLQSPGILLRGKRYA